MKTKKTPKIRFKEFTDDWELRELNDVKDVRDGTHDSPKYYSEGYPFVTSKNLTEYGLNLSDVSFISKEDFESINKRSKVDIGDIIFGMIGTIGNPVILEFDNFAIKNVALIKRGGGVENEFLIHLLKSSVFNKYIEKENAGGTQKFLGLSQIRNFKFLAPNKEEQIKIGQYFKYLDTLIILHQQKLDKLKNIKKSMLEKMFPKNGQKVPQIRFAGFSDDWEQRKLIDMLIQPISDGPHESPQLVEDGIPFISVDAIVDNKIDFSKRRGFITESYHELCCKKYTPQFNDVYLVKSGSTVGKTAIVETYERFNIWSPLAAMRCGDKSEPYFLYYLLQTNLLQIQVFDKSSHGTQPNLSMRALEKFDVCIPSKSEQKKISEYFKNLDRIITLHQQELDKLKNIKKSMLEKMFV